MARPSQFLKKITSLAVVTSGATIFFAGLNVAKGKEKFYDEILMPILQNVPPEASHRFAVLACKYKIFPETKRNELPALETQFFGHKLKNPVGIAAGFDKQGEAIEGLERIGFGFVEIGSVTPLPQAGNPKPRVFRLPRDQAVINRYGFNSDGHEAVSERIRELRCRETFKGVVGINLGKNKNSDDALSDYVKGVLVLGPLADYLVINISSPNTPGLRDLQGKKDLELLLSAVLEARDTLAYNREVPILLKLAPDLTKQDIKDISNVIKQKKCRVDGLIISNTTVDKSNLQHGELSGEDGGLSGAPLKSKSTQLIADMYYMTSGKIPIIGVGGIFNGQDAFEKIQAGASYIQLYTALIYYGPPIVDKVKVELDEILKQNGYKSVSEAVGKNYKKYLSK